MKQKADIVILGNLLSQGRIASNLIGGGNLYLQVEEKELTSLFDIGGACIIRGDVEVQDFDGGDKVVVVCGWASAKKGGEP